MEISHLVNIIQLYIYTYTYTKYFLLLDIQEDEIWDFFKDCGPISAVRIIRDNMTCIGKGFGYVDFEVCKLNLINFFIYIILNVN